MKDIVSNLFGFLYTLSMGDYVFFIGTFIIIMTFLYIIYLLKQDKMEDMEEMDNLESIKNSIEKDYKPKNIEFTDYELEQEENAIISYEELVNNKSKTNISYDENYNSDSEILVKKITVNNETNLNDTSKIELKLMSYEKEEAFLTALKQLQQNLIK